MSLSPDTRSTIWYGFIVIFAAFFAFFLAYYSGKKGMDLKKCCISTIIVLTTYIIVLTAGFIIDSLTNSFVFVSGNIYFLPGAFLCALTFKKYLKCSLMDALDHITVSFMIARSIHVIGCCFVGCCQGHPADWGIYSALSKTTVVPVNAIESICLLLTWFILDRHYRKSNYVARGMVAAYGYIAFGAINFVTDIFTVTFSKLFFMTSMDGIIPFITMCIGFIMLYILKKKNIKTT